MDDEMISLRKMDVFVTITHTLPEDATAIPTKRVFSKKADALGNFCRDRMC